MPVKPEQNLFMKSYTLFQFLDVFHAIQNDPLVSLLHLAGQNEFVQDGIYFVEVEYDIQLHSK